MLANLSTSITTAVFNILMMRMEGEDGVAAITLLVYTQYLFQAFFTGFSIGVAPVFSYNYGSGNRQRLARLFGISVRSVLAGSAGVFLIMELFAPWMVAVFAPPPSPVYDIAVGGIRIYSTAYLFYGTNVFTRRCLLPFPTENCRRWFLYCGRWYFCCWGFLRFHRCLEPLVSGWRDPLQRR
ncbi:MAG: MATE family efflux transporter [Intestinimonas butyriciproducens]|uniref:MATE family efflux transporter n=1 Tax=Intestinimonas butyriciproducens TaxID=1297617 RepID=UPI0039911522